MMLNGESLALALSTGLGLGIGWWLWHWGLKELQIERFREGIFALRDELFDEVANETLHASDDAYRLLRLRLNGFIRFGHRMSLPWTVGLILGLRNTSLSDDGWTERINALRTERPEVARRLINITDRMNAIVRSHILLMSPVLVLVLLIPLIIVAVVIARKYFFHP